MAADNVVCFRKGCKCATCKLICSRCALTGLSPGSICETVGLRECKLYDPYTYKEYLKALGKQGKGSWRMTEQLFNYALNGGND